MPFTSLVIFFLAVLPAARAQDAPLWNAESCDPEVSSPSSILGYPLGERPIRYHEMMTCVREWEGNSRLLWIPYASSHERRSLGYAVISSEANLAKLETIKAQLTLLGDPRRLRSAQQEKELLDTMPAVAWMGYSIHGDELSGTDAAVGLIYRLIAARDEATLALLDDLVILVDPLMNPDGRERCLAQLQQFGSRTPNVDVQAIQHNGVWPAGRTNHYLFDLNRDWVGGVHPETRGRMEVIVEWKPQLVVDAHEMGALDTYLFNPPREPFFPRISPLIHKWWKVFASDQAAAFDRFGWSYYTREWLEFWYPGYTDGWATFHGAVGILYEQAGIGGGAIRQQAGNLLTYGECVHHHYESSFANLHTLHGNKEEILRDYLAQRRHAIDVDRPSNREVFLFPPNKNQSRLTHFVETLRVQGIEVERSNAAFTARNLRDTFGNEHSRRDFPEGTLIVHRAQPASPLVGALLDFDPHMSSSFLRDERRDLEKKAETRFYDVSSWSLPLAYGLDAYLSPRAPQVRTASYVAEPSTSSPFDDSPTYGWIVDGTDDEVLPLLGDLLAEGLSIRVAETPFTSKGKRFPRGSLLIRRKENKEGAQKRIARVAQKTSLTFVPVTTALSADEGPDLGGGHFPLVRDSRIGLLVNAPFDTTSTGTLWHHLDLVLQVEHSLLDATSLGSVDLRAYDVLILPDAWSAHALERMLGPTSEAITTWVEAGGTLITVGASSEFAIRTLELSSVELRRDALDRLDAYDLALQLERTQGRETIDERSLWSKNPSSILDVRALVTESDATAREEIDSWQRRFSPTGVMLKGELNQDHWLTFGCRESEPLFFAGRRAFLAKSPVDAPARLSPRKSLRLSGLLWPEAATRIADSAWATVESRGHGQVVSFVTDPCFRGYLHGPRRLFSNAVLLGPGLGTSRPIR